MEQFGKVVVTFILAMLFIGLLVFAFMLLIVYNDTGTIQLDVVKKYYIGQVKGELTSEEKRVLKGTVSEVGERVYQEATEHNPEGDVLPDHYDDSVKQKIKEEIR